MSSSDLKIVSTVSSVKGGWKSTGKLVVDSNKPNTNSTYYPTKKNYATPSNNVFTKNSRNSSKDSITTAASSTQVVCDGDVCRIVKHEKPITDTVVVENDKNVSPPQMNSTLNSNNINSNTTNQVNNNVVTTGSLTSTSNEAKNVVEDTFPNADLSKNTRDEEVKSDDSVIGKLLGRDFVRFPSPITSDQPPLHPVRVKKNKQITGIYFSAHWCGPCRRFTPALVEEYKKLKEEFKDDNSFEVIFVSSDRDEDSFESYFKEMPWLALPYEEREKKQLLCSHFGVRGIPTLAVLDENYNILHAGVSPQGFAAAVRKHCSM